MYIGFGSTPGSDVKAFKLASAAQTPEGIKSSVLSNLTLKGGQIAQLDILNGKLITKGPVGGLGSLWVKLDDLNNHTATQTIDLKNVSDNTVIWENLVKQII
jgi:hypothetical protein